MNLDAVHRSYERMYAASEKVLGLPLDQSRFPWPDCHGIELLKINNLGDPWRGGIYGVNTFEEERQLLTHLGKLFHLDTPSGYVTSCGTEGNLAGIRAGLAKFPDAVVYASDKVHCSVPKACEMMRCPLETIISVDHRISGMTLWNTIRTDVPAIIVLTAGTVMAGAIDHLDISKALDGVTPHYIHVDAALSGLTLPYLDGAPAFDFRLPIDSLSVSLHKQLGVPIPSGALLCREPLKGSIDYGTSQGGTIGGSRCGLAPLLALHALEHYGEKYMRVRAHVCLQTATYAHKQLLRIGWPCERVSQWSQMVLLKKPSDEVCRKYSLASENGTAHVVCMPHVTEDLIDEFVSELEKENR